VEGQTWHSVNDFVAGLFLFLGGGIVLFLVFFFVFEFVCHFLLSDRKFTLAGIIAFTILIALLCVIYRFLSLQ
jgi:hypothetical protein